MSMIMATTMKVKPTSSLKPKKLLKLDIDRDIDPTMMGNLIWMCETQKVIYILLIGKCKNVYFIMFAPSAFIEASIMLKRIINWPIYIYIFK
jgi:hypothetical protein